ncbi:MAG: hypothetical protein GVY18_12645 [Bacteroidetes bacterium]|nr:hypothetical protein [Bacteroidota bacterium]
MARPPRLRPRFRRTVSASPSRVAERLRTALAEADRPWQWDGYGHHFVIRVPEAERHFWSPQLSIDLEATSDATTVRGLFGPHPSIWTLFVAAYGVAAFAGVTGLLFGLSQWTLDQPPIALWAVPGAALLAGITYGVGLVGRRLGYEQVLQLRDVIDEVFADAPGDSSQGNSSHTPITSPDTAPRPR